MDALLMCGGRGTRLDADGEKPLFEVGGRPLVDRVHEALAGSRVETVYAVGSPHVPETLAHVPGPTIEAPGEGYVADLGYALERVDPPVLTATADLPLLAADAVDAALAAHADGSMAVYVPAALKRQLGVTVDSTVDDGALAPTGLNVVGADEGDRTHVTRDARLAVDVDRVEDAAVAEVLL